ncbi:MAG: signal peptidase I [Anaerolineales bacterium]|nr:signal peptidase I [Anaerolineales bacterium]
MDELEKEAAAEETPSAEKVGAKRLILDILETAALALFLFAVINFASARVRVNGLSMQPTLQDGEFVLVSKLSYKWGDFQRGDVIVFYYPNDLKERLVKRIIGLPGDRVSARGGQVFVNEQALNEYYIAQPPAYSGDWVVPNGSLFVLGDNRNNSRDSKDWGLLPQKDVIGKAVLIYWPPRYWKALQHPQLLPSP